MLIAGNILEVTPTDKLWRSQACTGCSVVISVCSSMRMIAAEKLELTK
jgi:hypothetical protein